MNVLTTSRWRGIVTGELDRGTVPRKPFYGNSTEELFQGSHSQGNVPNGRQPEWLQLEGVTLHVCECPSPTDHSRMVHSMDVLCLGRHVQVWFVPCLVMYMYENVTCMIHEWGGPDPLMFKSRPPECFMECFKKCFKKCSSPTDHSRMIRFIKL